MSAALLSLVRMDWETLRNGEWSRRPRPRLLFFRVRRSVLGQFEVVLGPTNIWALLGPNRLLARMYLLNAYICTRCVKN
jgi:hypothetical protein